MKLCLLSIVLSLVVGTLSFAQDARSQLYDALRNNEETREELVRLLMVHIYKKGLFKNAKDCLADLPLVAESKFRFLKKPIKPPHFAKLSDMTTFIGPQSPVEKPEIGNISFDFCLMPNPVPEPVLVVDPDQDKQIFLVTKKPVSKELPGKLTIEFKDNEALEDFNKRCTAAKADHQQKIDDYENNLYLQKEYLKFVEREEERALYRNYLQKRAAQKKYLEELAAYETQKKDLENCQNYADNLCAYETYNLHKEVYEKIHRTKSVLDSDKHNVKALEEIHCWLETLNEQFEEDTKKYINCAEQKRRYEHFCKLSHKGMLIGGMYYLVDKFQVRIEHSHYGYRGFTLSNNIDAHAVRRFFSPSGVSIQDVFGGLELSGTMRDCDGQNHSFSFRLNPHHS